MALRLNTLFDELTGKFDFDVPFNNPPLPPDEIDGDERQLRDAIISVLAHATVCRNEEAPIPIAASMVSRASTSHRKVAVADGHYIKLTIGADTPTVGAREEKFITKQFAAKSHVAIRSAYELVVRNGGALSTMHTPGGIVYHLYLSRRLPSSVVDSYVKPVILLVEDEDYVRDIAKEVLETGGYRVIEARRGADALTMLRNRSEQAIDLLLTDVVMPGMNGRDLARCVQATFPKTKIIFMSGYSEARLPTGDGEHDYVYLQKPFSLQTLIGTVRRALTAEPDAEAYDVAPAVLQTTSTEARLAT